MNRRWNARIVSVLGFSSAFASGKPTAAESVVADTRDDYNLFKPRLMNRQLFEQLAEPDQSFRIGREWEQVAYAIDAQVASVQNLSGGGFNRFHGYFVFDNFAALRSPYGVDVNLNLALFNPSSSDGVRVSSFALPGARCTSITSTRTACASTSWERIWT